MTTPAGSRSGRQLARRIEAIAATAQTRGHKVSARNAYLRAAAYYAAALTAIDGVEGGDDLLGPMFTAHRRCFDAHVQPARPARRGGRDPVRGRHAARLPVRPGRRRASPADPDPQQRQRRAGDRAYGPASGAPALARGYNALVFDGPGQQSMLFERHIPFRPDWEHVITPVVDFLRQRPEVDAGGSPCTASARQATGSRGRSPSSTASPPPSPTRGSMTWRRRGARHLPPELLDPARRRR